MRAVSARFAGSSSQRHAITSARTSADVSSGFRLAQAARTPSTFSGLCDQSWFLVATIWPWPAATATLFQGSPTQKPSTRPACRLCDSNGGGMTIRLTSASGSMPAAASQ